MITLADLAGRWRLTRQIIDVRADLVGHLEGVCDWLPDAAGLRQVEQGVLRYGDTPPMQASRSYLWRATPQGLAVFFDDGRPFHHLRAGDLTDRHWCDPDTYDVTYDLGHWPDWTQSWKISGPRKDMQILSRFQPLA